MAAPIVNEQPSAFAQVKRHLDGVSKSRVRQTRRYQEEQKGRKTVPEELANRLRGRRLLDIHTFRMVFAVDPCMNRHLIVAVSVSAMLAAASCAKDDPRASAAATQPQVAATAPSPATLLNVKVEKMEATPAVVHRGQPVTVHVRLSGVPASTPATLAWFGPDGWLVRDNMIEVTGNSLSVTTPADVFEQPGHYRAQLRSGNVTFGEASVDVAS